MPSTSTSLATLALAAATIIGLQPTPASAATPPAPEAAVGLLAYGSTSLHATDASRYDTIIINADQFGEIPALRAANPNVKILEYKDIAATVSYSVHNGVDDEALASGVGYAWAKANHPGWFLRDSDGKLVEWADYAERWWMDVGDRGYQNTWATNVAAEAQHYGFDGVMMDDVNAVLGGHLPGGSTLAKYPTDSAYATATGAFLANVVPQLRQAGVIAVANVGFYWNPDWEALYKKWVSLVDGVLMEFWTKPGQTSDYPRFGNNDWDFQMQQAADVFSAGRLFLPLTYGSADDTSTQEYARASFLMAWDGGASTQMWVPSTPGVDPWQPAWTATIGQPTAPRHQLSSGVWRRSYSAGTVLVNPSSRTKTVDLGGTYLTVAGTAVSTVTLPPLTGQVLSVGDTAAEPAAGTGTGSTGATTGTDGTESTGTTVGTDGSAVTDPATARPDGHPTHRTRHREPAFGTARIATWEGLRHWLQPAHWGTALRARAAHSRGLKLHPTARHLHVSGLWWRTAW